MSFSPFSWINLAGTWSVVGVVLALPREDVRWMLPEGMVLGAQDLTPEGTHPVVLYFGNMYDAHLTFPRVLISDVNYREQLVGIPWVYSEKGVKPSGPYLFMPQLYLDNALFVLGGRAVWGFQKNLARIILNTDATDPDRVTYSVQTVRGRQPVIRAQWTPTGDFAPVEGNSAFAAHYRIMRQIVISRRSALIRTYFTASNYWREFQNARVRPVDASALIRTEFVVALPTGTHKFPPMSKQNLAGAFELQVDWSLTLPYLVTGPSSANPFENH